MTPQAHPPDGLPFRPAALTFFRQLARNNDRGWFAEHRATWETEVRGPLRDLVEELDVRLAAIAPELVGDPRRSIFRIHRDVRFSRDKSPYKTNAGCWWYHMDAGKGVGQDANGAGAGFYFHLSATEWFSAGGIWMPARPVLARVREALAEDPDGFGEIVLDARFKRRFGPLAEGAMLKRLPRGYPPGHPAERWLRYKSFTVSRRLTRTNVLNPRLADILARDVEVLRPFLRWLNRAVGYRAYDRR